MLINVRLEEGGMFSVKIHGKMFQMGTKRACYGHKAGKGNRLVDLDRFSSWLPATPVVNAGRQVL